MLSFIKHCGFQVRVLETGKDAGKSREREKKRREKVRKRERKIDRLAGRQTDTLFNIYSKHGTMSSTISTIANGCRVQFT